MFNRAIVTISSLVLLATVSGCIAKLYSGPKRDRSELALIQAQEAPYDYVILDSLDGESTRTSAAWILPGKHTIEFHWYWERVGYVYSSPIITFELTAEAGKTYVMRANPKYRGVNSKTGLWETGTIMLWIEDFVTGDRVGTRIP